MPFSRKSILAGLTFILLVAAGLRLAQIGAVPPGLHYDEAADTIIAREIAEGRGAPIFVEAYTGKEVLFFYWAAAWMKLIGSTPFAMRLAAAMLGVLTVAATYWAVREMLAGRRSTSARGVAMLAAAFAATSFWHVLMSRLGFRSIAEPCVQALALAAVWRGVRLNRRRWLIAGGGLTGLNLYTYLAARLFPLAVALLFIYLIAVDSGHRRARALQFGWVVASAAIVFAPLGVYFLQHPDAFLTRIAQVAPRADQSVDVLSNVVRALGMFFVEGDPYVRFNLPGRPLFPMLLGVLFIIGVLLSLAGMLRGRTRLRRSAYAFVLSSTLIMLLPTALAVNEITPSNLRAIGLIPIVFVFPALGAWWLLKLAMRLWRRMQRRPFILFASLLLTLTGIETGAVYFGEYVRSPDLYYQSDGDLVDIARRLNDLDATRTPIYVHALHYRHPTLAALARDFYALRSITGADVLVFPSGESMHVFAHLALPDRAWLDRFLPDSTRTETVAGPDGQPSYLIAHIVAAPSVAPKLPSRVNFGNVIELLGADLESTPESGGQVDVTLFWRVLASPDRGDYALFAELRDAWDFEWGRADSFDYPAEQWTPGELIVQRLYVPIAAGAPRGEYRLAVGWYSAEGDRRWPIVTAQGGFGGTATTIAPISIARAAQPLDADTLGIATPLDAEAIDGLTLLGASLETPSAPQGAPIFFTLFWRADGKLADWPIEIVASGASADVSYRLSIGRPVHDTYPFDEWPVGEVVADRYGLRIPADAASGDYRLMVRVESDDWIEFGAVRIEATQRRFGVPPIAHPLDVTFGGRIDLLGYEIDRTTMQPGESLTLRLVWRARTTPGADYTVFTHLLDPAGVQRGGKDNPPLGGAYPTSRWIAGEVVVDEYVIPLDADAPPGAYTIELGFYRFDTGARLPLSIGGDSLRLASVRVES